MLYRQEFKTKLELITQAATPVDGDIPVDEVKYDEPKVEATNDTATEMGIGEREWINFLITTPIDKTFKSEVRAALFPVTYIS